MGSYIYDNVRNALGGQSFKAGSVSKNWSPNEIRALYIMRSFIIVVDYLKGPILYSLDENAVGLDLQNPNRIGSLNNLLSNRQLSCMEEIYVDDVFQKYPNVMDLAAYARSVISSQSRLRFYAYASGMNPAYIVQKYQMAFNNGVMDFTYAKSIGGIRYVDTGNADWYKKYFLRPQYYPADADGGRLHIWFSKCEKQVASAQQKIEEERKSLESSMGIMEFVRKDINVLPDFLSLVNLMNYCRTSTDKTLLSIASIIRSETMANVKSVDGLTPEGVLQAARAIGDNSQSFVNSVKAIMSRYNDLGVYSKDGSFDVDSVRRKRSPSEDYGFIPLSRILDKVSARVYTELMSKKVFRLLLEVSIMDSFERGLPDGWFSEAVAGAIIKARDTRDYHIKEYLKFLHMVCGTTPDACREYISNH